MKGIVKNIRILLQVFSKYRWHVAALVVLGSLSAVLEGIGINAVIPLISFFSGSASTNPDFITRAIQGLFSFFSIPFAFRFLVGFILGLFFLRAAASVAFGYVRGWVSADFLSDESEEMLSTTLLASWPFLLAQKIGTLQNTLVRDIQRSGSLLEVVGQIIQSFTGFFMYLVVAFNISPYMTLATLVGGGVLLVFVRPLLQRTRNTGQEMAVTEKNFTQFLSEHIIGMKPVKAAGAERKALHKSSKLVRHLRKLMVRMAVVRSLSTSMFQPFSLVFVIVLFAISYKSPGFSIISFAAVLYLIQKIFTYLESGQSAFHSMSELIPYAQNVLSFKNELKAHREESARGNQPFSFAESLAFENVTFAYQGKDPVLHGISFTIRKGETIGLIGPSGAGKTSIADIILRLFRPATGALLIDGVDAETFSLEEWRGNIGYVSQEAFLFNGSIEENIRFYRNDLSEADIISATKKANIYDFIKSLPGGLHSGVGDRGVMLSGGQKQRIVLARALAGHPELLVLDEATSALDHESEQMIQKAIQDLRGEVTVCIIAHRPSTIAGADRILALDKGRIVESGSPGELLKDEESYFYKMQHSM